MDGKALRIVFMGTPDFAVASLKKLVDEGYQVVGVVTAADKPAGRGQKVNQSAVKRYADEKGLPVLQPEKLKDPAFIEALAALKADLQVVVAFRMLPEMVWDMPRLGTFNLHASLLPKYRGAAPLNWAIIKGEKESGVTTFKLQHEIDTGNIIFQEKVEIGPDDNVEVLHDQLMDVGARLVVRTVDALAGGKLEMKAQEELIAQGQVPTPAPKIFKDDCLINWNCTCLQIKNLVRGLSPYPAAWTRLTDGEGKETSMKIYKVEIENTSEHPEPGRIESDLKGDLKIAAADGFISLKEVQLAGKKRMKTEDFLRGFQQITNYKAFGQ
ncbi:methionyl-tRNA formyltransferase [Roseimarinus sediminis]|jgi:methionyl-tRNA formyltransferase|uniref:methionyl-tRNA formyltransferase n=1 Tax=Roseimarinus sediminis TaxID=1610899 RepID=UPI003D1CD928